MKTEDMTAKTEQILAAFADLDYAAIEQIRKAAEEIQTAMKADFMAQAQAMGIDCKVGNGRKPRKPRASKQDAEV
jgi:hypothetical protein